MTANKEFFSRMLYLVNTVQRKLQRKLPDDPEGGFSSDLLYMYSDDRPTTVLLLVLCCSCKKREGGGGVGGGEGGGGEWRGCVQCDGLTLTSSKGHLCLWLTKFQRSL